MTASAPAVVVPVVGPPAGASPAAVGVGAVAVTTSFSDGPGQLFYPCPEEQSTLAFSRSLSGEGALEAGGSSLNPPQKKKVCSWFSY